MTDTILGGLLIIALLCSVMLVLISSATMGRKLTDIEFQRNAGVDGIRGIQARINVRTHALRVFLSLTFIVITVLLIADAPIEVRTWVNRILFAILMISYVISAILDWRDERRQMRILQDRAARPQAEDDAVVQAPSDTLTPSGIS